MKNFIEIVTKGLDLPQLSTFTNNGSKRIISVSASRISTLSTVRLCITNFSQTESIGALLTKKEATELALAILEAVQEI